MKSLRLLSQSPISNIPNKMRFMNLKPVVLSKSRLESKQNFENEEERSLDDLKTKLLLQYWMKQKAKRNRKRGRNNISLVKSVDQINEIKNKSVLEGPVYSRFSRKSTGVTKSSTKKRTLPKIASRSKNIWKDSHRFTSPRITPLPTSSSKINFSCKSLSKNSSKNGWNIPQVHILGYEKPQKSPLANLSKSRLRHMKEQFDQILNYSNEFIPPVLCNNNCEYKQVTTGERYPTQERYDLYVTSCSDSREDL